jgi:hypothetical protein
MKLSDKFQTLMAAAAFAEEGEFRTAREIASEALTPAETKTRELGGTLPGNLAMNAGSSK